MTALVEQGLAPASRTPSRYGPWLLVSLAAALLASAPWTLGAVSTYWFKILTEIMIWSLFAASVNILFGYAGLLSFGQALFFGLGAYGFAGSIIHLGWSFWPALAMGLGVPMVVAVVVGAVAVRLTWHYFTILTVVFSLAAFFSALSARWLTGGDDGLSFAAPSLGMLGGRNLTLRDSSVQYFVVLTAFTLCWGLKYAIVMSRMGLAFAAVRENGQRAELVGYDIYRIRLTAFVISAFFAAVSGVLYAAFSRYVSVQYLYWTTSGEAVIWTLLGGAGTLFGPILGTATLIIVREELAAVWQNYLLLVGLVVILMTRFAPQGLIGLGRDLARRLGRR